uniref:Secreted protein n=1 Tax=Triticum urartu TaxID=4572 RepID=A0A8R7Q1I2_TRIUA
MRTTIHFYFCVSLSLVSFQYVTSTLSAERLPASRATWNGGRPRPTTSRRAAATLPGRRRGPCLASGAYRQASASPPQRCPWSRDPVATPAEALPTRGACLTQRRPRP